MKKCNWCSNKRMRGKSLCKDCRSKQKKEVTLLIATGKCVACRRDRGLKGTTVLCEKCAVIARTRRMNKYNELREKNLCTQCEASSPDFSLCFACRSKRSKTRSKKND